MFRYKFWEDRIVPQGTPSTNPAVLPFSTPTGRSRNEEQDNLTGLSSIAHGEVENMGNPNLAIGLRSKPLNEWGFCDVVIGGTESPSFVAALNATRTPTAPSESITPQSSREIYFSARAQAGSVRRTKAENVFFQEFDPMPQSRIRVAARGISR